jgi:hypothetical protein
MDAMMLFDSTSTPLPPTQFRLGNYSFWRPSASRNSSIPRRVKPSSSGTPMPTHSTTRHVSSRRKLTYQGQCPSGVERRLNDGKRFEIYKGYFDQQDLSGWAKEDDMTISIEHSGTAFFAVSGRFRHGRSARNA